MRRQGDPKPKSHKHTHTQYETKWHRKDTHIWLVNTNPSCSSWYTVRRAWSMTCGKRKEGIEGGLYCGCVYISEWEVAYLLSLHKGFMFVLGLYGVLDGLSMHVYGHRLPTIQKDRFVLRHNLAELRADKHTLELTNQSLLVKDFPLQNRALNREFTLFIMCFPFFWSSNTPFPLNIILDHPASYLLKEIQSLFLTNFGVLIPKIVPVCSSMSHFLKKYELFIAFCFQ